MSKYNVGDSAYVACFNGDTQKYVGKKGTILSVKTTNRNEFYYEVSVNEEVRTFMEFGLFDSKKDCEAKVNR